MATHRARAHLVYGEWLRREQRRTDAREQAWATAWWIVREGAAHDLDPSRLAAAGDSVGGDMTAAVTLPAKQRGGVRFVHQSLHYPVTDAARRPRFGPTIP